MSVNYHGSGQTTAAGIEDAANGAGIEVDALKAVMAVETNGKPFDSAGRLSMLFEPHVFYKLLSHRAGGKLLLDKAVAEGLAYERQGEKPYPRDSYPRFEGACDIDRELACQAASWGMGQILGENFHDVGCGDAVQMVELMATHPDAQVEFMAQFIKHNRLVDDLNAHDWAHFARGYNGKNYAVNHYDKKLADAYAKMHVTPRVAIDGHTHPVAVLVHPDAKDATGSTAADVARRTGTVPAKPALSLRDRLAASAAAPATLPATQPKPAQEAPDMNPLKLLGGLRPGPLPLSAATAAVAGVDGDVKWVQQRLKDLGYHEVGMLDGKLGARTQGAILAFRNEVGLPLQNGVDDALKLALISAPAREIDPARAAATVADLKPTSPILQAAGVTKGLSIATAAVGLFTGFFGEIGQDQATAAGQLAPFKLLFAFLPPWAYGAATLVLGVAIWLQGVNVERARVQQFQTGRTT